MDTASMIVETLVGGQCSTTVSGGDFSTGRPIAIGVHKCPRDRGHQSGGARDTALGQRIGPGGSRPRLNRRIRTKADHHLEQNSKNSQRVDCLVLQTFGYCELTA
jgi:hypothetical protein